MTPMHDHVIPVDGQMSDETLVTIPASVVDWVSRAAYTEIGSTAEALDTAAFSIDREGHPEWFRGPMESLREVWSGLPLTDTRLSAKRGPLQSMPCSTPSAGPKHSPHKEHNSTSAGTAGH
jgi:hypothetical protein